MTARQDQVELGEELRRTAWHEAAHALTARLLNLTVLSVTIKPGQTFHGQAAMDAGPLPVDVGGYNVPMLEQPRELRDYCERQMLISLAGPLGGAMSHSTLRRSSRGDPDGSDADRAFALAAAAALERQSPRLQEMILAHEAAGASPGDEADAMSLAVLLNANHPQPTPTLVNRYHVEMLRQEAHEWLMRHLAHLEALAAALHERIILAGDEIDEILAGVTPACTCHRWP